MAIGTPAYMSPEQSAGDREVDGRSDLYSLGVVAYQMLAGVLPFQATSTPAMLIKHLSERPVPVDQRRPDCPPDLAAAVMRMLEKDPAARFASADELEAVLLGQRAIPTGSYHTTQPPAARAGTAPLPPGPGGAPLAPAPAPPAAPERGGRLGAFGVTVAWGGDGRRLAEELDGGPRGVARAPSNAPDTGDVDLFAPTADELARWEAGPVRDFRRKFGWYAVIGSVLLLFTVLGDRGFFPWFALWTLYIAYRYAKLWSDGFDWHDILRQPRDRPVRRRGGRVGRRRAGGVRPGQARPRARAPAPPAHPPRGVGDRDVPVARLRGPPGRQRPALGAPASSAPGAAAPGAPAYGGPPAAPPPLGGYPQAAAPAPAAPAGSSAALGAGVRQAAADRDEIVRLVGTMPKGERERLGDVAGSARALAARVEALAGAVTQLDRDAAPGAAGVLEAEIVRLEAEANPLDRAASDGRVKRLAYLKRQRRAGGRPRATPRRRGRRARALPRGPRDDARRPRAAAHRRDEPGAGDHARRAGHGARPRGRRDRRGRGRGGAGDGAGAGPRRAARRAWARRRRRRPGRADDGARPRPAGERRHPGAPRGVRAGMRPALALVRPVTAPTPAPGPGSAPDPLLDRVVAAVGDRYDVREEIGRGGMAVVYRAVEVRLQRPVALKVLPPELAFRDGVRARFLREAQTAAQLSHPNIAPVFAAGDDGGVAWLAMALVDGETLGARLARPPRPAPAEAARVLAEVADALAYAHARGVVHRDVKPDNILLDRESGRAVVTDFGIARAAEADERLTVTGAALGTPAYMSPEQAMGEQELDGRSDQYALGVVGYQLLTGVLPFQASGATAMLMKHVGEAPRPVRERAPAVPPRSPPPSSGRWPSAPRTAGPRGRVPRRRTRRRDGAGRGRRRDRPRPDRRPSVARPGVAAAPGHRSPPAARRPRGRGPSPHPSRRRPRRPPCRRSAPTGPNGARRSARGRSSSASSGATSASASASGRSTRASRPARSATSGARRCAPAPCRPCRSPPRRRTATPLRRRPVRRGSLRRPPVRRRGLRAPVPRDPARAPRGRVPPQGRRLVRAHGVPARRQRHPRVRAAVVRLPVAGHRVGPAAPVAPARRRGLGFWDVMFSGAGAAARAGAGPAAAPPLALLEHDVRRFRRRSARAGVFAGLALLMLVLGLTTGAEVFLAFLIGFGFAAFATTLGALAGARPVRRAGIPLGAALSDRWRDAVAAADPRPRAAVLADEARALVGDAVLAGPYGAAVREAVEDRRAVRDTVAALGPADRALLPMGDVAPTLDGLVANVGELARRLDQVDRDSAPGALEALEARIAAARQAGNGGGNAAAADREGTLRLLERQRESLVELAGRRGALADRWSGRGPRCGTCGWTSSSCATKAWGRSAASGPRRRRRGRCRRSCGTRSRPRGRFGRSDGAARGGAPCRPPLLDLLEPRLELGGHAGVPEPPGGGDPLPERLPRLVGPA
jgi:serine/threonine-protein kinase